MLGVLYILCCLFFDFGVFALYLVVTLFGGLIIVRVIVSCVSFGDGW